ncbi:putative RNA polymerase [Erwinia phage pEp_SNUABM_10]|uniref:DNA-directed RNA polymerase n=1 Tax=Erwinia phage pEp_SNUABM_09 TaxID=2601644 RepID=A0A5J6DAB1_9CAUD|nr:putative RNA polymerase [Erwinia phage pEp_SNUABM_09]QOC57650.1 putative RNA polymerase [Erwinia phage pEp_SNUABM_03]QOC57704.1 putative RNA polymerase [Erwinia phage pEp_SNUABM_04]QOC57756.1 putative RNA polymerase [Erwinia phage pEp_SNUABM_10]QOC57805.1 putative RNA polymerase [Erwinia phage pEp_SNUABM_11]
MNVINAPKNDFSDISNAIQPFNVLADHYGEDLARAQLQLEHEAYTEGEKRFLKQLQRQIDAGEVADNAVAKPLVETLAPKFAEAYRAWWSSFDGKKGPKPAAMRTLKSGNLSPESAAHITLKMVLASLAKDEFVNVQYVTNQIGQSIEDELRFGRIREQEREFFMKNVQDGLKKRVGLVYKKAYMQVVEKDMLGRKQLDTAWTIWTKEETIHVGVRMLELLIESTGLVKLERNHAGIVGMDCETVTLEDEYVNILSKRAGSLAGISPMYQPCVVPPRPWVGINDGGYWAAGRKPLSMIRVGSRKGLMRYNDVEMPEVYRALNIAQNTPWKINKKVLDVVNEIVNWKHCPVGDVPALEREELPARPDDIDTNEAALKHWKKAAAAVYRKDKARVSRRLSMEFTLAQANKFAQFKAFWFPYNMDWRGRVYAIPAFNPQGNDMAKGLMTLAKGKPVGEEGLYWLKIHGANCAGVDKVPFPERIKFIEDNHENILASAADPLNNTWWTEQDSPFCFLAFCFEYQGVTHHGKSYVSSLPLAFDGSCSGIQHFSAMLRDEVGGRAVNLVPSDTVQDIYGIVAAKVNEALREAVINGTANETETVTNETTGEITERIKYGTAQMAGWWLAYGVTRKVTKRSVMTLAYGSKEFGFREQVLEDIIRPALDNGTGLMFVQPNQAAGYMAKLIWEAVSVTVVAAVEAMNWLKSAAKLLAAEVKDKKTKEVLRGRCAVHWVTPDGFPVWQEYRKPIQTRLNLMFLGQFRLQPTINTHKDSGIDAHKQESGIAPNFVHSQDGSHLRKTVVHAHDAHGVESFALIHDSFGTIPADAGKLFKAVRETMVETYENNNVLEDFREQFMDQLHESQLDKMPPVPSFGTLNLQDILKSDFAFA